MEKNISEIAKKLSISPRFVGRVCGQNNHVLIIPCHRILRSNGTLGGFTAPGGMNLKKNLVRFIIFIKFIMKKNIKNIK